MNPTFQAHPIPQNVTNFEFHLVGDMTIKQFGYLAVGLAMAFVTFMGLAQPFPFIAYPLIVFFAGTGAAFAFVPIQERPLDHWMAAFFKAIFHPTKLSYQSKLLKKEDPLFNKRLPIYMQNKHAESHTVSKLGTVPTPAADLSTTNRKPSMADRLLSGQLTPPPTSSVTPAVSKTIDTLQPLGSVPAHSAAPAPLASVSPAAPTPKQSPKPTDLKKTVDLAKEAQETQSKIMQIEKQLEQIKATVAQPGTDAKFYVNQFQSLLGDLQKLNEHASNTAHDLALLANAAQPAAPVILPQPLSTAPVKPLPTTPKIVPSVTLTTFSNVVNGVVTDSQGNYVEGAVVVAHDKQGLPVRALRSNKLGQFVAATPLSNGTYTIIAEKDNLVFDQVAIELKNEVLPPILITAKKQIPSAS